MRSVLFFAAMAIVSYQSFANASGPVEFVDQSFGSIVSVIKNGNEAQRINTMCRMARQTVGVDYVTKQVLGNYATSSGETKSIQDFKELVPSVVVTAMQSVTKYLGAGYTLHPNTLPRGAQSKGVRMDLEVSKSGNILKMIIVVTKIGGGWKITNVESVSYSRDMLKEKKSEYAKIMAGARNAPVGHLVDAIRADRELIHCR